MHEAGWAGISWPKEYGGRGASLIEQAIFGEEMARAEGAAPRRTSSAWSWAGPVVIAHGTDEQKERFLEPILSGDGDLVPGLLGARVRLRPRLAEDQGGARRTAAGASPARRSGPRFAHEAKWCMLVARTDPDAPKHKGLTYFICDMEQDGVEVRPLRQITGEAEFNEIFFEGATSPTRTWSAARATAGWSRSPR